MKYLLWPTFILILGISASQAASQEPIVNIDPSGEAIVSVGQNLTILCSVGVPILTCRVEIPNMFSLFVSPNHPANDGVQYFGESMEAGQCGVLITNVKESHDGIFRCSFSPIGSRFESSASTKIVVTSPPSEPELIISPGSHGHQKYEKGENLMASCRARAGRPAANVSLFLNNEPIGDGERSTISETDFDGNLMALKNVSRILDSSDNGKTLLCVVDHIALEHPLTTTQQLEVFFGPQPQPLIEVFGYVIGQPGIVNVTVQANPRPDFVWYIDEERIDEKQNNERNRFETSTPVEIGRGLWAVTFIIKSVMKSDSEKKYSLEASNGFGDFKYQIALSTLMEPTSGLIGRACIVERDCATVDKNVYCNATRKQCACMNGFIASVDNKRCLAATGRECRTDNECLNGMEEGHGHVRCLINQCVCFEGFESSEGKCQPVKESKDKSGGIRLGGVSIFAIVCFVLLSSVV